MSGLHIALALCTKAFCTCKWISPIGILHHAMRIGTMPQALRMTYFMEHHRKQLAISMRTIRRKDCYTRANSTSESLNPAMWSIAKII